MSILVNMPEGEIRVHDGVELMAVEPSQRLKNWCEHCHFAQGELANHACPQVSHFINGTHTVCHEQVQNGRNVLFMRPDDYAKARLKGEL